MFVIVPSIVRLQANDVLRYNCPLSGASYEAEEFFNKHRGKLATYIGREEHLIGPLDFKGRIPGRYLDPEHIKVRFEGEDKEHLLQAQHFVLLHPREHEVLSEDYPLERQRIGDLLHEIRFYPGDEVRYVGTKDIFSADIRKVGCVFIGDAHFAPDGVPRYNVLETAEEHDVRKRKEVHSFSSSLSPHGRKCAGDEIELVARGNVWALYHDSSKLSFKSPSEEAEFWAQNGVSAYVASEPLEEFNSKFGLTLREAYTSFEVGAADILYGAFSNPGDEQRYQVKVLHACFAQHRDRVRSLTEGLWSQKVKASAA